MKPCGNLRRILGESSRTKLARKNSPYPVSSVFETFSYTHPHFCPETMSTYQDVENPAKEVFATVDTTVETKRRWSPRKTGIMAVWGLACVAMIAWGATHSHPPAPTSEIDPFVAASMTMPVTHVASGNLFFCLAFLSWLHCFVAHRPGVKITNSANTFSSHSSQRFVQRSRAPVQQRKGICSSKVISLYF